jgi:hypothetical protein
MAGKLRQRELRCESLTVAGVACTAPVTSADARFCIAHDPARRTMFADAQRKGGANTRHPRVTELIHQRVEAEADQIIQVYVDALYDAEADHRTRMDAADRLLDRVLGRPKVGVELAGADGEPITPIGRLVVENPEVREAARAFRHALAGVDASEFRGALE